MYILFVIFFSLDFLPSTLGGGGGGVTNFWSGGRRTNVGGGRGGESNFKFPVTPEIPYKQRCGGQNYRIDVEEQGLEHNQCCSYTRLLLITFSVFCR